MDEVERIGEIVLKQKNAESAMMENSSRRQTAELSFRLKSELMEWQSRGPTADSSETGK